MTTSPRLPLDIRLHSLESQVLGVRPSLLDDSQQSAAGPSRPITRRVRDIHDALERASAQSEGLKRLLAGYDQYLPLLDLPSVGDPAQTGNEAKQQPLSEADLLPDSVKVAMLLEAAQDIRMAERNLREIELLRHRGVEGAGDLEELLPLKGNLIAGMRRAKEKNAELERARREVGDLLMRYNNYADTVSDLFLELHHRMSALEEGVAKLERKKRKELAERY